MPEFSRKLMGAWKRGGSMRIPFSYNSGLKLAAAFVNPGLPAENTFIVDNETHVYPGFGAVMRNGTDGYIVIKAGEIHAHYDHDEGSFIWYEKGCPLVTDYGTQYNPNVDQSYLHNRISILHKSDWSRGVISAYGNDFLKMDVDIGLVQEWPEWPSRDPRFNFRSLPPPEAIPTQHWTRRLVYLKNLHGLLIIDEVTGGLWYDWNLQLLAKSVVQSGDHYFCGGSIRGRFVYIPSDSAKGTAAELEPCRFG